MKNKSRSIAILTILFGYILLQFIWWEVLLVRQSSKLMNEKQKLLELSISNSDVLKEEIAQLHKKNQTQIIMIVCEGTVFLLLLLFGVYKVKTAIDKEVDLINAQQNFFLSITHELKTPIAATKLQLQTLLKQKLNPQIQTDILESALKENERLNQLIDNVLLASRIENKDYSFELTNENISELTEGIVFRYYLKEIETRELALNISPQIKCLLDLQLFPSILINLIDNAIKYSGQDRRIIVDLFEKQELVYLKITDNGYGIDDENKNKVFNRFYRIGNEETRRAKGTGLGLFIVRNIIEKHQANISITDNQPKGTVIQIEFNVA
jgi:signal transduction histidine kinase